MEIKMVVFKGNEIRADAVYRLRCELGRDSGMEDADNRLDITMDANNGTEP